MEESISTYKREVVKMVVYIGIDPGQQGAVTLIEDITKDKITIYDMPLLPQKGIDGKELHNLFLSIKRDYKSIFCVLEKAQAMQGQGSVGGFNYGVGYGKILSSLEVNQIPFQEVHPMRWKKEFGITSKRGKTEPKMTVAEKKQLSLGIALKLFPKQSHFFHTERGKLLDGRVESWLLAEYARRIHK